MEQSSYVIWTTIYMVIIQVQTDQILQAEFIQVAVETWIFLMIACLGLLTFNTNARLNSQAQIIGPSKHVYEI